MEWAAPWSLSPVDLWPDLLTLLSLPRLPVRTSGPTVPPWRPPAATNLTLLRTAGEVVVSVRVSLQPPPSPAMTPSVTVETWPPPTVTSGLRTVSRAVGSVMASPLTLPTPATTPTPTVRTSASGTQETSATSPVRDVDLRLQRDGGENNEKFIWKLVQLEISSVFLF